MIRALWGYAISGDLPIVLLQIADPANIDLVRQLVQAHAYWRLKGLAVDLVIWNEDHAGYRQVLQERITGLIAAGIQATVTERPGGIFVRPADRIPAEDRILLQAVSPAIVTDSLGPLADQVNRPSVAAPLVPRLVPSRSRRPESAPAAAATRGDLLFSNGLGGFTPDGREYSIKTHPRGQVRFRGEPLASSAKGLQPYRRQVQMVFQDPTASLNPRQTIYEIVAEGLRIHSIHEGPDGESEEQMVARALSRAGLRPPERFYLLYPHELSGGQRQRVVIAGALALDPTVIVADEPVSNLDASVRGEILSLLMKLRRELKISILIVTHDLGLAGTVADRVAVMYLGRIVEIGPAEEVLQRPRHPYTKALLNVVPEAGGVERPILAGEPPDPKMGASAAQLTTRYKVDPLMGGTSIHGNFVTFEREA